ncbi:MAG: hypothetical protein R2692_07810 [Microbacterium sp.]
MRGGSRSSSRGRRGPLRRDGRPRNDADLGEAELRAGRVLETQVFDVHAQFAELAEQASELAGGVVDHDDERLEPAVLTVLAGQTLDAVVAAADRVGDGAARAGCFGLAQRLGDGAQVEGELVEHVDDGGGVRAQDLHPQLGRRRGDARRVAHA